MRHRLPADLDAIVIEWRSAEDRREPAGAMADLVVRAGGRVTVGRRLGGGQPAEGRITPRRLQDLLAFALEQNHFFEIDGSGLGRALAAAHRRREAPAAGGALLESPAIDAGTTRILVAADGRRRVVQHQDLLAAARDRPEPEALGRLRAIELRLLELAQEIAGAAGGCRKA